MLREFQSAFSRALLSDQSSDIANFIRATKADDTEIRFDVYRNNVRTSLVEVMRSAFPAVNYFAGRDNFAYAASRFLVVDPPRIPYLSGYGAQFPKFLRDFAPARAMPWLSDLARLEWACQESLFAADAEALRIEHISQLGDYGHSVQLKPHPSLRVISSSYPVLSLWERARSGENKSEGQADYDKLGETVLLIRPQDDVEFHLLSPGEAALVTAILGGEDLAEALEATSRAQPAQDLGYILAVLVARGCFMPPPVAKS